MLMKQTGDLMDKAIKGMLANLDPYTVYFNEQDVVRFKINNTGEYWNRRAIDSKRG
jgi:carboxyl-terminal processing protease